MKAVLIIDMPKKGWDCPCNDNEMSYCTVLEGYPECLKNPLPNCPLRPLPERMEEHPTNYYEFGYLGKGFESGWNAFYDKLVGGENHESHSTN